MQIVVFRVRPFMSHSSAVTVRSATSGTDFISRATDLFISTVFDVTKYSKFKYHRAHPFQE
jgi:hypothetical protein